jgi:hypothetical protein
LASRQVLHRCDERQAQTATGADRRRWVLWLRAEHRIGDRLDPRDIEGREKGLFGIFARRTEPRR